MKLLKNICIAISVLGFILAIGTAGETELDPKSMTDTQLYTRMFMSLVALVLGYLGTKVCNIITQRKHACKVPQRTFKTVRTEHKTVA